MSFPEAVTPPALRTQARQLQHEAWPSADPPADNGADTVHTTELTHDPLLRPVSMLLVDDGTVLAALDVLSKTIVHTGRTYRAGGLSTVVVRRSARGRGHGHHLVAAAHEAMAASGLDLGLFTCDRPLQGFYESAGWQALPGAVLIGGTPHAPFPSDQPTFDKVTMADFFSTTAQQTHNAFHHTRIELYPGEIDKLW